jgi:hypothetical protein
VAASRAPRASHVYIPGLRSCCTEILVARALFTGSARSQHGALQRLFGNMSHFMVSLPLALTALSNAYDLMRYSMAPVSILTSCHSRPHLQAPRIVLLKDGTDTSQGTPQLISNINACTAVADVVRTTLGPRGMDKLIHDSRVLSPHTPVEMITYLSEAIC